MPLMGRIVAILAEPDELPVPPLLILPLCDFSEPPAADEEEEVGMGGMVVFSEEVVSMMEGLRFRLCWDGDPGRVDKLGMAAATSAEVVGEDGLHTLLTFWRNSPPSFLAPKFISSEEVCVDSFSLMILLSTSIQPTREPESGNLRETDRKRVGEGKKERRRKVSSE